MCSNFGVENLLKLFILSLLTTHTRSVTHISTYRQIDKQTNICVECTFSLTATSMCQFVRQKKKNTIENKEKPRWLREYVTQYTYVCLSFVYMKNIMMILLFEMIRVSLANIATSCFWLAGWLVCHFSILLFGQTRLL